MLEKRNTVGKCGLCDEEFIKTYYIFLRPDDLSSKLFKWKQIEGINKGGSFKIIKEFYLDLRPIDKDIYFSTIRYVSQCPNCNYCAYDISQKPNEFATSTWVKLEAYKKILNNDKMPEQSRRHLCLSFLSARNGDLVSAATNAMFASWLCDDYYMKDEGDKCRIKYLNFITISSIVGSKHTSPSISSVDFLIIIDVLRRLRRFSYAKLLLDSHFRVERFNSLNDRDYGLRNFQEHLVKNKDSNRYSFIDLKKFKSNESNSDQSFNQSEIDFDELYFDAMTDGQYEQYEDFNNLDGLDDLIGR